MTKDAIVIEVRASDPRIPLKQEDFDNLEFFLVRKYIAIPNPNFTLSVKGSGISQGAVWYGCKNQATYDFIKDNAPTIDIPETKSGYVYVISNDGYRYLKAAKVPVKFWMSREEFKLLIMRQNPTLAEVVTEDGGYAAPHFEITSGLLPEGREDAIKTKFFSVCFEIMEELVIPVVHLFGELSLGFSTMRVTGAGIEPLIEDHRQALALQMEADEEDD